MRARPKLFRCLGRASVAALALCVSVSCANKKLSPEHSPAVRASTAEVPAPEGLLAELTLSHPGASFAALRELGGLYSALLPAGFPVLVCNMLGLPPLTSDSFDAELPVFGALLQGSAEPGWLLAIHALSGPELVARLSTGDQAPFHAVPGTIAGLTMLEAQGSKSAVSLAVFDNYLLAANSRESLIGAGPFAARTLPKRPRPESAMALRFSKQALSQRVIPALRAQWADARTHLARLDDSNRNTHGGRAPDFGDPAQVILGADAVVESALSLIDDADSMELDIEPFADRLQTTLSLKPEAGSNARLRLVGLGEGSAEALLALPAATQFALGLSRTPEERDLSGKAAGDDWVRLLGPRISSTSAQQLRAALTDWELGRGSQSCYGFVSGADPGAFLWTTVADADRLRRAGPELIGLLSVPGLRAPLAEFLGAPRVTRGGPSPSDPAPSVMHARVDFAPSLRRKSPLPPLSFAWLVEDRDGYAAAGRDASPLLKQLLESARGQAPTLGKQAGIGAAVTRMGEHAAAFAYFDARLLGLFGAASAAGGAAPLVGAIIESEHTLSLRIELSKPACDLALRSAVGL